MNTLESFSSLLQRRNSSPCGTVQAHIHVHANHSQKPDYHTADALSVKLLRRTAAASKDENQKQQVHCVSGEG